MIYLELYNRNYGKQELCHVGHGKTAICGEKVYSYHAHFRSGSAELTEELINKIACSRCRDCCRKLLNAQLNSEPVPPPPVSETTVNSDVIIKGDILKLYTGSHERFTVPDGVKFIGECAFARCSGLTSVEIPDSVEEIRDCAFALCQSLTEIILPQNIRFGEHVFHECQDLAVVKIRFTVGAVGTFDKSALETMFQKL